jgi:hypothetical protein
VFLVYGRKCLSRKAVHNWVEKFFQGRSKVTDDAWQGHPVEIVTEATLQWEEKFILADKRLDIQCINWTSVFPWFSIQQNAWSFEVSESVHMVGAQRTEGSRKKTKWVCPCSICYSMQMKEKICLTGLLLGTNHGCITTNPNQSVLQCSRNIPVYLLVNHKL